jgi:membrane associated rhomboid family serine protease
MLFLWVFGNNAEDAMGGVRFLIFYFVSGLFAHLAQIAHTYLIAGAPPFKPINLEMIPYGIKIGLPEVNWFIPVVGASGAISGVLAAYGRLYPRARIYTLVPIGIFITTMALPAFLIIGYWFLFQILSGLLAPSVGGGVAFWAHIGGFIGGWLSYRFFLRPEIRAHLALRKRWRNLPPQGWI